MEGLIAIRFCGLVCITCMNVSEVLGRCLLAACLPCEINTAKKIIEMSHRYDSNHGSKSKTKMTKLNLHPLSTAWPTSSAIVASINLA